MLPVAELPTEIARNLIGVFTDIDDTLTSDGRLPAAAYEAVERLQKSGVAVVPITGRPAGWCDMVARFWPVAGVVGENGAFYFRYDHRQKRMRRWFATSDAMRAENRRRLEALGKQIVAEVPGAAVASDQLYRETDLAIDFCEDVSPLPTEAVDRIVALFAQAGATAKVSSIHVNGWFGSYDKLSTTRVFTRDVFGVDLDATKERFVFCGDSPNDAPMFAYLPYGCGVANVLDFIDRMNAAPAYVAEGRGSDGFVEIADRILTARRSAGLNRRRREG